jgi:hypothetical protein
MSKPPLPAPTHAACQAMGTQFAEFEVEIVLAFSGVYDADAVRRALAEICLRRAAAAGLTDSPAAVARAVRKRR